MTRVEEPMHITTPTEPTAALWDGPLEPPVATRSDAGLAASIGRPAQWADGQLLGDKWQPPLGGGRFYLLRLVFTLRRSERSQASISAADFCLRLHPQPDQQAIVFDAYPREQLVEQDRSVTLGIGPAFKLGAVDVELAKAETTIDFGRAIPVIRSDGLAEAAFCWRYTAHRRQPLLGSRDMVRGSPPAGRHGAQPDDAGAGRYRRGPPGSHSAWPRPSAISTSCAGWWARRQLHPPPVE